MGWWSAVGRASSICLGWRARIGRTWPGCRCSCPAPGLQGWPVPLLQKESWPVAAPAPRRCWQPCGSTPRAMPSDAKDGYAREADLPGNDTDPQCASPGESSAPVAVTSPRPRSAVAWLALLLALAAAALAGWSAWQLRWQPNPSLDNAELAATRA